MSANETGTTLDVVAGNDARGEVSASQEFAGEELEATALTVAPEEEAPAKELGSAGTAVSPAEGEAVAGELDVNDINSDVLGRELCIADLPEPDLFIRTGGEQRISNFMLWQLAYTELYFTDLLWPDFAEAAFTEALHSFAGRQRRFGQTGDQIEQSKRA